MTAVACGLGLGAGMAGLAWSWWGHRTSSAADRRDEVAPGSTAAPTTRSSRLRLRHGWVLLGASAGGVVAMLVTGWAVAVPIGALAIIGLPKLFRQTSNSTAISRIEAIATWTEMLQGTLAASAGIGQAIVATAPLAPLPIRSATTKLSARLEAGAQPREALLQFADDVADPSADRVVCALLLAVAARGQRLGDLLTALADTTRDEVALRLRIETARASVRSGVRTVLVFSVCVRLRVGGPCPRLPRTLRYAARAGSPVRGRCPLRRGPGAHGCAGPSSGSSPATGGRGVGPVTVGVIIGGLVGLGLLGVVRGVSTPRTSLEALSATLARPAGTGPLAQSIGRPSARAGAAVVSRLEHSRLADLPRWPDLLSCLAVTGDSMEQLSTKMLMAGTTGLLAPPALWACTLPVASPMSFGVAVAVGLAAAPLCTGAPVFGLIARAKRCRRHFCSVLSSFVDLVVLSLAGGVGIEGALLAASQVSPDWAARRMRRVLLRARDSGEPPWGALGRLGQELGVPELVELSSSLQLAGTEGTRIRQSLAARAVSLRRRQQAEDESAANATTERLFLPGALLLVGFLLFVGYPAFGRIVGGW